MSNVSILDIYNRAYFSYISKEDSLKDIIEIFTLDIIKLLDTKNCIVLSYENNILNSFNEDTKWIDLLHKKNILKKVLKHKKSFNYYTMCIIPLIFNNNVNGVIIIDKNDNLDEMNKLGFLMGTLFYNVENKRDCIKNENKVKEKLLLDTLNCMDDEIIITNIELKIIFCNQLFLDNYKINVLEYFYDIFPKTIGLLSSKTNFYRNKRIHIDELNIELVINSFSSNESIYHLININHDFKKDNKNSKNLVAYLSHELRNPIQAITTGIYIINKTIKNKNEMRRVNSSETFDIKINSDENLSDSFISIDELDQIYNDSSSDTSQKSIKSVIRRVDSACNNLNIIINDILDLSKIDNDELVMNMESHYLEDIIDMIKDEYDELCNSKNLEFQCIYDNIPEFIYTDATRLYQIISNLLSNAIKYSKSGIIKLHIQYEKDNIIFKISDQGKGIRKEELNSLFKDFGTTSNSNNVNSNGLGLCICQKLARLLNGNIEVLSQYKKGSIFTFNHPIKMKNLSSNPKRNIDKIEEKALKGNIMIVDDDENITSLFKMLLKWFNYDYEYELNIDTVNKGDKSRILCNQKKYDLIFMDIDLDGEDGRTICKDIITNSKLNKETPIVAVSANIKFNINSSDFDMFSDFILKPFSDTQIKKTLMKFL